ncbi:hypothetical protein [Polyangium aurulentum]|uniref:hypothetical protein n=1 Tax=Polyangium aurulentum TaxID=2567896 RepID=UPI0010ADC00C|nr:hypothetical protein [Polyangium aurulentum]UQA62114.1 hypothetical protein E8A73_017215 [Polyangium aurulentum]
MSEHALTPAAPEPLRYHGLDISEEAVSEDHGGSVVSIAREEIRSITLCWGLTGERIPAQIVFALVCLAVGGVCASTLIYWTPTSGDIPLELPAGSVSLILGVYALRNAFRRGYFLRIRTDREVRKLAFKGGAELEAIERFLQTANRTYGYAFDRELG